MNACFFSTAPAPWYENLSVVPLNHNFPVHVPPDCADFAVVRRYLSPTMCQHVGNNIESPMAALYPNSFRCENQAKLFIGPFERYHRSQEYPWDTINEQLQLHAGNDVTSKQRREANMLAYGAMAFGERCASLLHANGMAAATSDNQDRVRHHHPYVVGQCETLAQLREAALRTPLGSRLRTKYQEAMKFVVHVLTFYPGFKSNQQAQGTERANTIADVMASNVRNFVNNLKNQKLKEGCYSGSPEAASIDGHANFSKGIYFPQLLLCDSLIPGLLDESGLSLNKSTITRAEKTYIRRRRKRQADKVYLQDDTTGH